MHLFSYQKNRSLIDTVSPTTKSCQPQGKATGFFNHKKWNLKIWSSGPKSQKHFLPLGKSAKNPQGDPYHSPILHFRNDAGHGLRSNLDGWEAATTGLGLNMMRFAVLMVLAVQTNEDTPTTLDLDDRVFLTR